MSEGLTMAKKYKGKKNAGKALSFDVNKENDPCLRQHNRGKLKKVIYVSISIYETWISPYALAITCIHQL